jgi:hypothetical protein
MNIVAPQDAAQEDAEQELSFRASPDWIAVPRWIETTVEPDENTARFGALDADVVAADDDLDDFDEDDFDDEFDDDFEEELEDEYELSEFEDVTEEDLAEGDDDDLDTLGGDFVDEDAEPEEAPAADDEEPAGKDGKDGKEAKDAKSPKDGKKKGKPAKSDDDENFDDED